MAGTYTPDERDMDKTIDKLADAETAGKKETDMGDIAGLLALMQGNKGMDLPGLMALCKDKGYDKGFGGEGMFMFVFLILFLFAGGGWGNMGNKTAAAGLVGADNLATITSIYDRISAAQAASTEGFANLNTHLCSAIAEVVASVRNQGDRTYDATRNVGDQVRDCCCKMQAELATILCKIDGVSRDIRDADRNITNKIDLAQERTHNELGSMECRLSGQIKDLSAQQALGFERQACLIKDQARDAEIARLQRENCALKEAALGNSIADHAVARLTDFAINHYKPTNTPASPA